jgi:hypothetical protein
MRRWLLSVLALAAVAVPVGVSAQTPTQTPTVTPTATLASIGTPKSSRAEAYQVPITRVLLDAATTVNASGVALVEGYETKSVQVTVGTCTSYTLVLAGSIDCSNWVTLQTITEAGVAQNATGLSTTFTQALRCMRAVLTAMNGCTVSAVLHAVP